MTEQGNSENGPESGNGFCEARRKDGGPCRGRAYAGRSFCFAHDPKNREAIRAGQAKGGASLQRKLRQMDLVNVDLSSTEGVIEALERIGHGLLAGRVDGADARVMTLLLTKLLEARDLAELERSLDEAED